MSKFKILFLLLFISSGSLYAKSDFCRGFEIGYKTIKGNNSYVPYCPYEPYTPYNSTPYQEGLKAGITAAGG